MNSSGAKDDDHLGSQARLYHALELWDWFASIGWTQPLGSPAHDMGELIAPQLISWPDSW